MCRSGGGGEARKEMGDVEGMKGGEGKGGDGDSGEW